MEGENKKETKVRNMFKKLEKCLSISKKPNLAPTGHVWVLVGPEKQRFAIKTESINHPSFKILLEDVELQYGFANNGPLLLPCEVDLFFKVLAEMESCDEGEQDFDNPACGFSCGSCSPFSPARSIRKRGLTQGCGLHCLHTPTRFIRISDGDRRPDERVDS